MCGVMLGRHHPRRDTSVPRRKVSATTEPTARLNEIVTRSSYMLGVVGNLYARPMSPIEREVLGHPDELPDYAVPFWPDLSRWPTPRDVTTFKRSTRGNPDARLAVLSRLRSWSEINLGPIWAWTSAFLAVMIAGIGGTIAVQAAIAQLIIWAVIVVLAAFFLVKVLALSTTADSRRRRAHIWLRALE